MKKLLILAAATTALALSAGVGPVSAAPGFNASQYCTDNGDFGFSHGDCTSIIAREANKSGSDDPAAFCKAFKLVDPTDFDAFYKNIGDCVSSFH